MPSFISDGYVFHAGVNPVNGIHEGIEFDYRPMTPSEAAEYVSGERDLSGAKLREHQAKKLVEKLQGWRARTVEGVPGERLPQISLGVFTTGDSDGNVINTWLMSQMIDIVLYGAGPDYTSDKDTPATAVKN